MIVSNRVLQETCFPKGGADSDMVASKPVRSHRVRVKKRPQVSPGSGFTTIPSTSTSKKKDVTSLPIEVNTSNNCFSSLTTAQQQEVHED